MQNDPCNVIYIPNIEIKKYFNYCFRETPPPPPKRKAKDTPKTRRAYNKKAKKLDVDETNE